MKQLFFMISLLFILLFFHEETIIGTRNGLLLWYQTLIPSLLPFILVTNALAETNAYQAAAHHFQKYFPHNIYEKIAILLGNLCGYPLGGKILNDFVQNQYLSPHRANTTLSLASQASPMFLIGYVYMHILKQSIPLYVFIGSIYGPTFLFAIFKRKTVPSTSAKALSTDTTRNFCITDTFLQTTTILVVIGMYVILFSIVLQIVIPLCKSSLWVLPLSTLEITTGLHLLETQSSFSTIQIPLICALSSFGGFCSAFQIKGVLTYPSATIKKYLLDKCILSTGTFFIVYGYLYWFIF